MTFSPIDFGRIHAGALTIQEVADRLTVEDLKRATEFSVNTMLAQIAACTDADVAFVPLDPDATEGIKNADGEVLGWTLSHVIVHTTATGEASAFAALDLARGVALQGISRYETPWDRLITIEQCRQRLEESLRMRLASLAAWPDHPDLSNRYTPFPGAGHLNAKELLILGLEHDDIHQHQLAEIVRQINAHNHRA